MSLPLTNTYKQHLRPSHLYTFTTRILSILSPVARVTLIIGCRKAHGTMQEGGVQGRPVTNKGLVIPTHTYTHTTPWSVCVFMSNSRRFPRDTCACLPCYDNCRQITLQCVRMASVCVRTHTNVWSLVRLFIFERLRAISAMGLYAVTLVWRVSRRWISSGQISLSLMHCPMPLFLKHARTKPGGTPGQGLQIKGMSKGTVTVKGQRGRRRESES